mmetsp:Transcript_58176/g.127658  ORF Transcript_58176/g.127658 Transcript_58176/m.127658 type:complete len:211 (+) Transcript_58176:310-942(+)
MKMSRRMRRRKKRRIMMMRKARKRKKCPPPMWMQTDRMRMPSKQLKTTLLGWTKKTRSRTRTKLKMKKSSLRRRIPRPYSSLPGPLHNEEDGQMSKVDLPRIQTVTSKTWRMPTTRAMTTTSLGKLQDQRKGRHRKRNKVAGERRINQRLAMWTLTKRGHRRVGDSSSCSTSSSSSSSSTHPPWLSKSQGTLVLRLRPNMTPTTNSWLAS